MAPYFAPRRHAAFSRGWRRAPMSGAPVRQRPASGKARRAVPPPFADGAGPDAHGRDHGHGVFSALKPRDHYFPIFGHL